MVCQIILFSPTVDWLSGVCVAVGASSCLCVFVWGCVSVCILKGILAYFSLVVFSVDIAHSAGLYAFQCSQAHTYTLAKQYIYTIGTNLLQTMETHTGKSLLQKPL